MGPRSLRGIRIALKSLTEHRLRVALALLAIVIGVASVIIMVGVGKGAEQDVRTKLESMGPNLIVVSAAISRSVKGDVGGRIGIVSTLLLRDAAAIEAECQEVRLVAPAHVKKLQAKHGSATYSTNVVGTVPAAQTVRNIQIGSGRFFDEDDDKVMATVAVLGPTVVESLFQGQDPIGERIMVGNVHLTVIGVTEPKGVLAEEDQDDQILVPLKTAMNKLFHVTYLSNIFVEAADFERMHDADGQIREVLREKHRLREGKADDFTIQNQADVIAARSSAAQTFSFLVMCIALVSLVIGGVGILGVMLLSIREREVEIGLRRAVGATRHDILVQFMVESCFLGLCGGVLGAVVGIAVSRVLEAASGLPILIVFEYVLLSMAFSAAVGLIFGIYPSWRAAGLDPVRALSPRV